MFVLTLPRSLLKFNAKTPLLAPLFQFPPRFAHRLTDYNGPFPTTGASYFGRPLFSNAFLYPPIMLPISLLYLLQTSLSCMDNGGAKPLAF